MIDIDVPKQYIWTIDDELKSMVVKDIKSLGVKVFAKRALTHIDCTRIKDDMRLMQTIGFPYTYEMGRLLFGLEYAYNNKLIKEKTLKDYITKIETQHKVNLEFEVENPPVVYDKKKRTTKSRSTKKAKEGTLKGFEKPKKITAAESKKLNKAKILKNLNLGVVK